MTRRRAQRSSIALLLASAAALFGTRALTARGDTDVDSRRTQAAIVLEQIAVELSMAFVSVYVPPEGGLARLQSAFVVRQDAGNSRIDFTSFGHHRLDDDARESDQHEIGYRLDGDALVQRAQARLDDPMSGGTETVLLEGVTAFELELLDGESLEWVDSWQAGNGADQRRRLPLQVRVRLTLRDDDGEPFTLGTRARVQLEHALNHTAYR